MARLPHLPSRGRARIGGARISWTYAGFTVNADLLAFPKLTRNQHPCAGLAVRQGGEISARLAQRYVTCQQPSSP